MPRQARQKGEYLHIIVRGNGKQILFEDDSDRKTYLSLLQKYSAETGIDILAYCLMDNHVHLLVRDAAGTVSVFMKKLGVSYVQFYNTKYERTGHLFQDRYKSEVIDNDSYLLTVYRYILNNPVKAGICSAEEYPWSSYREYGKPTGLTDTGLLRKMIGDKAAFSGFVIQEDDTVCMDCDSKRIGDGRAVAAMRAALGVTNGTQLQHLDRNSRDEALAVLKETGLTVRQIERLTGINRGIIQKAKSSRKMSIEPSP